MDNQNGASHSLRSVLPVLETEMLQLRQEFGAELGRLGSRLYSHEGLKAALGEGLRQLGLAVWRAAKQLRLDQEPTTGGPPALYFWPGYESIVLAQEGESARIGIPVHADILERLAESGYQVPALTRGMYFGPENSSVGESTERLARAALYFHAALGPSASEKSSGKSTFRVGGTHAWLTEGPVVGVVDSEATLKPLEILQIQLGGDHTTVTDGHLRLPLASDDPQHWGREVARQLNDTAMIRDLTVGSQAADPSWTRPWPFPERQENESDVDFRDYLREVKQGLGEVEFGSVQDLRELLYSFWLAGCFLPEADEFVANRLKGLLEHLEQVDNARALRLKALIDALNLARERGHLDEIAIEQAFSFWISLSVPKAVHIPVSEKREAGDRGEQDLGSAMFFTNFPLPTSFLRALRLSIQSFYLSLRQVESLYLAAQLSARRAEARTAKYLHSQHAHAIGTEMTMLEFMIRQVFQSIEPLSAGKEYDDLLTALDAREVTGSDLKAFLEGDPTDLDAKVVTSENWRQTEMELLGALLGAAETSADLELRKTIGGSVLGTLIQTCTSALQRPAVLLEELIAAVSDITAFNAALMRVHDPTIRLRFSKSPFHKGGIPLMAEFKRAWNRTLVTFFERAFPRQVGLLRYQGTEEYAKAASRLFEKEHKQGPEFADLLRNELTIEGGELRISDRVFEELPIRLSLPFDAAEYQDLWLVPHEHQTLDGLRVFRVWTRELFLNALKAVARSREDTATPFLKVEVTIERAESPVLSLKITNSASLHDRERIAVLTAGHLEGGHGHEGLRFLKQIEQLIVGARISHDATNDGRVVVCVTAPLRAQQAALEDGQ